MFSGSLQDFGLTITGGGTLTVNGTARVHHIIDVPIFPDIHTHTDINIPLQTLPISLSPSTVNLTSDPSGSATVSYDDVDLSGAGLSDLNVDFRNGATWNFGLSDVVIQADVDPPDLIPNFDADITLSTSVSVDTFSFSSVGPATAFPSSGSFPTVQRTVVQNGTLIAALSGSVTGSADLGIFGNSSLGQIASISTSTTDNDFNLPGQMTLTAQDGPPATQVTTNLSLNLPLSIDLPFNISDTIVQNEPHADGSLDVGLSYTLAGNITLSNLDYSLTSQQSPPVGDLFRDYYAFDGSQWNFAGRQPINFDPGTDVTTPIGMYDDALNFLGTGGDTREYYLFDGSQWNLGGSQPIVFDPDTNPAFPLGMNDNAVLINFLSGSALPIPEPSSFWLAGLAALPLMTTLYRQRRRRRRGVSDRKGAWRENLVAGD